MGTFFEESTRTPHKWLQAIYRMCSSKQGIYQHSSDKHLLRYRAEFDFRHSNRSAPGRADRERTMRTMLGTV